MPSSSFLPLGSRPRLVNCGISEHGLAGREEYELPRLWCFHLYFYSVEFHIGREVHQITPGVVTLIPPGRRLVYHYNGKRHRHFFVHFAVGKSDPVVEIPLLQHLPEARDELLDRLQNMQRLLSHHRFHAEILFWGLLCDVAEAGHKQAQSGAQGSLLLKDLDEWIEQKLPAPLSASQAATYLDLSMTHVNRLIKKRDGVTTAQLLRKRRLQRAYRLLVHSSMPIKLLAAECGMEDLQQFNKLMRSEYGKSPRALRQHHQLKGSDPTWSMGRE